MRSSPPITAPSLPSTSPPTTSRSPSIRAPAQQDHVGVDRQHAPAYVPPDGQRSVQHGDVCRRRRAPLRSPCAPWRAASSVALNSATTSRATSRGSWSRASTRVALLRVQPPAAAQAPSRDEEAECALCSRDDGVRGSYPALRSFVADRDAQPAHAAIQVRPVGLQPARCLGHVPARRRQRAHDQRALVVVERVAERAVERRRVGQRLARAARRRPRAAPRARACSSTSPPACRIASRSTMFASSRTLPGQR